MDMTNNNISVDEKKEKADEMSQSSGLQLPKENTSIDFDKAEELHEDIGLQSPSLDAAVRSDETKQHSAIAGTDFPITASTVRSDDSIAYSTANVKHPEQTFSEQIDEKLILEMAEKIQRNNQENEEFSHSLDTYLSDPEKEIAPLTIGETPNSLAIAGANPNLKVIINPRTVKKCMLEPSEHYHGHGLSADIMKQIPKELRNPAMIFKGSQDNSLVAITELKDKEDRDIMIAVSLSDKQGFSEVNRISSVYGKDNMTNYLNTQMGQGNLIAVNKEKAEEMLHSKGLQLPKENTYLCFNDSITYSTANVKYPEQNFSEQTQIEYAEDKNAHPESRPVDGQTVHTVNNNKSNYSIFQIEHMGETAYFRDKCTDIDAFVKRFTDVEAKKPVKHYDFVRDCEKLNSVEFAEIEQFSKEQPAFSAIINLDEREFTVCVGDRFATTSLDEVIENVNNTGKAELSLEKDNYAEIPVDEIPFDNISFDDALMSGEEIQIIEPDISDAADVSAVNIPDTSAVEIDLSEQDNKTEEQPDAQSEAQKSADIGYIGLNRLKGDGLAAIKERINAQFGSSGSAIMPSNFGKRDYMSMIKPVEVSNEVDMSKYVIPEIKTETVAEASKEMQTDVAIDVNDETQTYIDEDFVEVEDDIDMEEIFNNAKPDNSSSNTSSFSDFGFDEDWDDYDDDDEDFSL